jgi:signal transduction histidine kinase
VSELEPRSPSVERPYLPSSSDHLVDELPPPRASEPPGLSEGLPPGFRMRHDARHVNRLCSSESPSVRLNGSHETSPAAAVTREPVGGGLEPAAARELTRHLGAIASCLHQLAESGRSLREQVVTDLARAELQRTTCFVQGLQVLGEDPVLTRRSLRVVELLELALAVVGPERRLAGIDTSVDVSAIDVVVAGDERWLAAGLSGMAVAILAAMQAYEVRGAQLTVGGSATPSAVTIEVAQDVVTFPAAMLGRFFDLDWADRPGGPIAAVPLVAARRIAELHGGRVEVAAGPRGGCRLTLTLPRAH